MEAKKWADLLRPAQLPKPKLIFSYPTRDTLFCRGFNIHFLFYHFDRSIVVVVEPVDAY
jgi:hypothetical protein